MKKLIFLITIGLLFLACDKYGEAARDDLKRACEMLTFDTIRNQNTDKNSITGNLDLLTLFIDYDVSWETDSPAVISESGTVTRPSEKNTVVTLTAELHKNGRYDRKKFTLTVLKALTTAEILQKAADDLTFDKIKSNNSSHDEIEEDLNLINIIDEVDISWTSDDSTCISQAGTVVRPMDSDRTVKLSANLSYNGEFLIKDFLLTVKCNNDADKIEMDLAELTFDSIKGENAASDNIIQNLNTPANGLNGSSITWTSNHTSICSHTGVLSRPTGNDETITMTALLSLGSETRTKIFALTVRYLINIGSGNLENSLYEVPFEGDTIYFSGLLNITGMTGNNGNNNHEGKVLCQAGLGVNSNLTSLQSDEWQWYDAEKDMTFTDDHIDKYKATFTLTQDPGVYYYAFRYSGDDGVTWLYCNYDTFTGSNNEYDPDNACNITVTPNDP